MLHRKGKFSLKKITPTSKFVSTRMKNQLEKELQKKGLRIESEEPR